MNIPGGRHEQALRAARMAVWHATFERCTPKAIERGTVHWSPGGAALLGIPRRAFDQPFEQFLDIVHPEDRAAVAAILREALQSRGTYDLEYRVVWPDRSVHWLAARCNASRSRGSGQALGIVWDATGRKLQELHNHQQRELAETTLGSIGDAVVTTDVKGRTRYLNRVAEHLTGWPLEQARGIDVGAVLQLVDEITGEPADNVAQRCLRQRQLIAVSPRSQLVTHDDRRVAVELSAAPIWSRDGELLGAVLVFRDISHERKLAQQISWYASHDTLTGLINRREFEDATARALHTARHENHVHALLYIDLDQFHIVNDTCGHAGGDVLLQLLTRMLLTHLRDSDLLARLGGDELGVLLPHCPPERAMLLADTLRRAVRDFDFTWEDKQFQLGASIGVAVIDADSKSTTDLLTAADQACALAKEQGRNRIHFYQESDLMLAQRRGEMQWVGRLKEAFEQHAFRLYALPIVSLHEPAEAHDEVLVRLLDPDGELVLPGDFIPAAERYDMMVSIDRWVIRAVCRHVKTLRDSLPPEADFVASRHRAPALYSINLSGTSLSDDHLHDYIVDQFVQNEVAPEQICFEVTETAAITHLPKAQAFMARLHAMGCRFSLDDFGAGLSSFAYLKVLPVDYLKIDGMFIRDIRNNAINCALVKAINEVGHVMGIRTVAEYVEDDETLTLIRTLGVDYAQGHAVGGLRPLLAGSA